MADVVCRGFKEVFRVAVEAETRSTIYFLVEE